MNTTKTLLLSTLLLANCGVNVAVEIPEVQEEPIEDSVEEVQTSTLEPGVYTIFSLNVHDFVFPEKSIEAVDKVITIHETYDVPIDIYLDDHVFQVYLDEAPELLERLKSSSVVTVGYHLRPPYPYYSDYDWAGINELSGEDLYDTLLEYETHALDLETGLPTEEPGGYSYLKEVIGYAPPIVAIPTNNKGVKEVLAGIYKEFGATYTLTHGKDLNLGDTSYGLFMRPEHLDYKLYEKVRTLSNGEEAFADAISQLPPNSTEEALFIGMKYHEDNFYCVGTPFWPIYWTDDSKESILTPPYDLSAPYDVIQLRPQNQVDSHWAFYESTVKYASEHQDEVHPLSIEDLDAVLGL